MQPRDDWPVSNSNEIRSERLLFRRVTDGDAEALRAIRATPEVLRWWGEDLAPNWMATTTDGVPYSIVLEQVVVGFIQIFENNDPEYRFAGIDLFLHPSVHGKGYGREAVARMVEHLVSQRGHHRITIDPAADNERAITCYRACGFRDVGIMRMYERNRDGEGWHDGLLMEYVVEPESGGEVTPP
jgi:RimJ/RimL family protein N-acetyltransferase